MSKNGDNSVPKLKDYPLVKVFIFVPFFMAFFLALTIYFDKQPNFCLSKECIDNFIMLFKVPLNLMGISVVLVTLSLTLYRTELTYSQNERQLNQEVYSNYTAFKESFKEFLNETERHYKFQLLELNSEWLLSSLYPNAKNGDFTLVSGIKHVLLEELPIYFNELESRLHHVSTDNFYTAQYKGIYEIYDRLIQLAPISQKTKYTISPHVFFTNENKNSQIIILSKDLAEFSKVINAFHAWQWFSYHDTLKWDELISLMVSTSSVVGEIANIVTYTFEEEQSLINSLDSEPDINSLDPSTLNQTQHRSLKRMLELRERSRIERSLAYEIILTHIDSKLVKEYLDKVQAILNINPEFDEISTYLNDWFDNQKFKRDKLSIPQ